MEAILVYNQCVSLNQLEKSTFTLEDGTSVTILGRGSDDFMVPLTGKLLQFFQSCRVNIPPMVEIGDYWVGPKIILGFESFDFLSSSQKGYLRLLGLPCLFHDLCNVDKPFKDHNVSLRVDIEMLKEDESNCSLTPAVNRSHVFEKHMDWDVDCEFSGFPTFKAFKHDACVPFKSAQNSTIYDDAVNVNVDKLLQNWSRSGSNWKLTMSLFLMLTPNLEHENPNPGLSDDLIPLKRMRTDETFADFTIITSNRTQVKCHRCMLVASSPYFSRMLHDSGTKEARTRTMELPRMSAEGIGAMLDYLYMSNIAALEGNSLVCVEVLEASHQYEIEPLQKSTKKVLLDKASNWYTPQASLRLLLVMKEIEIADLKLKAVKVFKKQFPDIKNLPAYNKLWKNPEFMKEVFEYVITDLDSNEWI